MAPPVCRNTPRLCAALLLPESCRVFQWNRKRAFASAPVKIRYICREPFCTAFHSSGCLNNSLVKIVVSGGSVVIFCFHADRYAVWMKIWVSSACCTGHKTGSFFVIAEMKLLSLPCTKVTSRLNRCWSCCAVPRRNLPREEGDELTTIRAALERASRANSEMRQVCKTTFWLCVSILHSMRYREYSGVRRYLMMYAAASACFLNIRTFWYAVCIQEKAWCLEKLARCSFRN